MLGHNEFSVQLSRNDFSFSTFLNCGDGAVLDKWSRSQHGAYTYYVPYKRTINFSYYSVVWYRGLEVERCHGAELAPFVDTACRYDQSSREHGEPVQPCQQMEQTPPFQASGSIYGIERNFAAAVFKAPKIMLGNVLFFIGEFLDCYPAGASGRGPN